MDIDGAVKKMVDYFGDKRFVDHTMEVLRQAEGILAAGKPSGAFVDHVVRLSCVYHDIGIPQAIRVHGSSAGPYQEEEGAVVAAKLLEELRIRPDILERVCYIVGHHHTQSAIDGYDFQIVWEADMLVNLEQGNVQPNTEKNAFIAEAFETPEGARRAARILSAEEGNVDS
jgi:hypothetical protein